jgi:predicted phosphodiesterase
MEYRNRLRVVFTAILLAIVSLTAIAEEPSWRFIVTSDSQGKNNRNSLNTAILSELAAEIVKNQVDFVLFCGDLVYGNADQSGMEIQFKRWRDIMQPVYDAGIGVYTVRGNHDVGNPPGTTAWNNVFKDKYSMPANGPAGEKNLTYSFSHKNAFIVGIDEYIRQREVNQSWLDAQFAANTNPHVFVFGHIPAFKTNYQDCLYDFVVKRDMLWASIEKAGGRTYFCGHGHFYNHARVDDDGDPNNDIHQYIIGTAGAPLCGWQGYYEENRIYTVKGIYHSKEYGYCLVDITGLDVTVTWMERIGRGKYKAKDVWSYTVAAPSRESGKAGKEG